jgi:peroxiredoxin
MKPAGFVLVAMLAAFNGGDGLDRSSTSPLDPNSGTSLGALAPEPPNTPVQVGDTAPNFAWNSTDNRVRRFRDVLQHAHALIVFAPTDDVLRSLESERESLADMGVVPVAVVEGRGGAVAARARRVGAHYLVVADPRHVIGSQFDVVDGVTDRTIPCWFVVQRSGTVRGRWHEGDPTQGWTRIAASALAIPLGDATVPVSRPR